MDSIKELKNRISPCEMRIRRVQQEWKDLQNPVYHIPNVFREVFLIGTTKEIVFAEEVFAGFFEHLKKSNMICQIQSISFLLPTSIKFYVTSYKSCLLRIYPALQFYWYDPIFPRKHLTIMLSGTWRMIIDAMRLIEVQITPALIRDGSVSGPPVGIMRLKSELLEQEPSM